MSSHSDVWDVVIIGAGLGGLAAGVTLAEAGTRVLLLEQGAEPGGYARDFRHGVYRFDISLHAMDGVAPGGWGSLALRSLGIQDQVRFIRPDPFYILRVGSEEIPCHADPLCFEQELIARFPSERQGIRKLVGSMLTVYHEMRRIQDDTADGPPPGDILELYPNLIDAMSCSWGDYLARFIKDPRLRAIFSAEWTYYGLPPSRLNGATYAATWASYHFYGASYPVGGVQAVIDALVARLTSLGAELRCGTRAEEILVEDGLARGVRTSDGETHQARAVISNAGAQQTLLQMVGPEHLPEGYRARIRSTPPSLSTVNVYLGIEHRPEEFFDAHALFVTDLVDSEQEHRAIVDGSWDKVPFLVVNYGRVDPSVAPDGHSVVTLMTLAPWDHANVWGTGGDIVGYRRNPEYLKIKRQAGETLMRRATAAVPALASGVGHMQVGTPLTNHRYTLNSFGAIFGTEQSVGNMYLSRLPNRSFIPNLILAGAWANPGGGQSAAMISGVTVGRNVLRHVLDQPAGEGARPQARPASSTSEAAASADASSLMVGRPAPEFALTTARWGRELSTASCRGLPAVLLFASFKLLQQAAGVTQALRESFPSAHQATVANIVVATAPAPMRLLLAKVLALISGKAGSQVPDCFDPADYILIAQDERGSVARAFGLGPRELRGVVAVIIDREGTIRAVLSAGAGELDSLATEAQDVLQWL